MTPNQAYSKIAATRHALEDFTRLYTRIADALPVTTPELNRAQYVALQCLSHLNHTLNALDDLAKLAPPSRPPQS